MDNDIMNLEEATNFLKFKSAETVRVLCKKKQIPYIKIAGVYRFSKVALCMYVAGLDVKQVYEKMASKMLDKMKEMI